MHIASHRRLVAAWFVALSFVPIALSGVAAQSPAGGSIHGLVAHAASGAPIASATVDVAKVGTVGSTARATTAVDGTFRVRGLVAGQYRVSIRALGFEPRTLPSVTVSPAHPDADAGTVGLVEVPLQLQRQAVTAQRDEVQVLPDRTSYVVRDMPTTKGGTALDVLRNVPSVDVDIDDNISLRGNQGVIVQINGRPSALKGAQLGAFLDQLPADAIDHVEVVPNPSAREDADGVAGIINIVLRQKPDAGASGAVTAGAGTTGHLDTGVNGGLQRGPLSMFAGYSLIRDNRPRYDDIFRRNLYGTPLTFLQENGTRTQIPLVHTVNGNVTYQPTERDELSADGFYSQRREWETQAIDYQTLDPSFTLTDLTDRHSRDVNHEGSADAALNYKHGFGAKHHTFASELRFDEHFEGGPTDILDRSLWPSGSATTTLQQTRTVWTHSSTASVKADYTQPLGDVLRVETGYKGTFDRIRTTQDVQNYDAAVAAMVVDTAQASDFAYDALVHDAYAMLVGSSGRVQFQGGLRAEHAGTTFDLHSRDQRFDNPYTSLFPSALVAFAIDDANQIKLSYSTRIRRPDDPDLLDPTPHALDALNVSVGNPHLRPEYIRALELGLQRVVDRLTVQVTPFYRHSFDAVSSLRTVDTAGVTTLSYANIATTDAYGTDATLAIGSGGRLTGFIGGTAYHQKSDAGNLDPALSASTFGWSVRTNTALRVSRAVDAQALVSYVGRATVVEGWYAPRTRVSFGVREKLMADRLSLTLRVTDPFSTTRERSGTVSPAFTQTNSRLRPIRALQLNASWTFGRGKKGNDRIDLESGGV